LSQSRCPLDIFSIFAPLCFALVVMRDSLSFLLLRLRYRATNRQGDDGAK
jgi:hypothetical protein